VIRWITGIGIAVVATWGLLVLFLVLVRPKGSLLREAMRLLPDTIRLLRRIATDRSLPRGARVRLWLLFLYLAVPIDLIPDFIPVLGYADDAIIVCAVLRSVVRRAGIDALRRHWPGTEDGFSVLSRLAGLDKAARVTGDVPAASDTRDDVENAAVRAEDRAAAGTPKAHAE
jgi:uncharacterized membrane protein YkvA (DUF1232 family)